MREVVQGWGCIHEVGDIPSRSGGGNATGALTIPSLSVLSCPLSSTYSHLRFTELTLVASGFTIHSLHVSELLYRSQAGLLLIYIEC